MATANTLTVPPGPNPDYLQAGADILPINPRQSDGDFFAWLAAQRNEAELGYTLIPAQTQGGDFSPEQLVRLPLGLARGVGKATLAMVRHYSGDWLGNASDEPDRRIMEAGGHERLVLVTDSDPATGVRPGEAVTNALVLGLAELDIGSGLNWHKAVAKQHPDRHTVSLITPGVSLSGKTLSIAESFYQSPEATAAENLELLRKLAGDDPVILSGTSQGSDIVMLMAALNLAANEKDQLNIVGINLVSSAVGARNVPESERFQELDASDKELIDEATSQFFKHMCGDTPRMFLRHPEEAAECIAALAAYALEPHKFPNRAAAIAGNLRGVQQGVEWEDIKQVAQAYWIHVLGGELDPLMQAQLLQWRAVKKIAPETMLWLIQGLGHGMTINGPRIAGHLNHMEQEAVLLAAA